MDEGYFTIEASQQAHYKHESGGGQQRPVKLLFGNGQKSTDT